MVQIISSNLVGIILQLPFLLVFSRLHGDGSFIRQERRDGQHRTDRS